MRIVVTQADKDRSLVDVVATAGGLIAWQLLPDDMPEPGPINPAIFEVTA